MLPFEGDAVAAIDDPDLVNETKTGANGMAVMIGRLDRLFSGHAFANVFAGAILEVLDDGKKFFAHGLVRPCQSNGVVVGIGIEADAARDQSCDGIEKLVEGIAGDFHG
jgi:hypothetical protein